MVVVDDAGAELGTSDGGGVTPAPGPDWAAPGEPGLLVFVGVGFPHAPTSTASPAATVATSALRDVLTTEALPLSLVVKPPRGCAAGVARGRVTGCFQDSGSALPLARGCRRGSSGRSFSFAPCASSSSTRSWSSEAFEPNSLSWGSSLGIVSVKAPPSILTRHSPVEIGVRSARSAIPVSLVSVCSSRKRPRPC